MSSGPLAGLVTGAAEADALGLTPAAERTFRAAVEAVCSYDDRQGPPPAVAGRRQPSPREATSQFAAEYQAQTLAFRQSVESVLALVEAGPLTAYGGRGFSQLRVPERLRFLRNWLADHDKTSLGGAAAALGIDDIGTLHRAAAMVVIQLTGFAYYRDPRTWKPVGWTGPWLGRDHEGEDLPFSHADHSIYRVDFGDAA